MAGPAVPPGFRPTRHQCAAERRHQARQVATPFGHDGPVSTGGYESWFVSARDPASARALWIRHTWLGTGQGPRSAALWCAVVDRGLSQQPVVVKQVFSSFPVGAAAGPGLFRGQAAMAGQDAQWELAITGGQAPLRPLRPAVLTGYGILAAVATIIFGAYVFASPWSAPVGYQSALARHLKQSGAVMYGAFW